MAIGSMNAANPQDDMECPLFEPTVSDWARERKAYASTAATHAERPKGVNKELLMKVLRIPENEAWRTLQVTTQLNHQDADSNMSRRFGTNDRMLRYRRINSLFYSDTFHTKPAWIYVHAIVCVRQGIYEGVRYEKPKGVPSSSQVVLQGSWSAPRLCC